MNADKLDAENRAQVDAWNQQHYPRWLASYEPEMLLVNVSHSGSMGCYGFMVATGLGLSNVRFCPSCGSKLEA